MHPRHFTDVVQTYVARVAIGASTVRGQGAGVARASRSFCASLDLRTFRVGSAKVFSVRLERTTQQLVEAMPEKTKSWGMARKVLNIFLRDALYNSHLSRVYKLEKLESFLELPLDAVTSRYLRKNAGRGVLPPWRGVKHLRPEDSARFQQHAEVVAERLGIAKVHLDAYWWGGRPGE